MVAVPLGVIGAAVAYTPVSRVTLGLALVMAPIALIALGAVLVAMNYAALSRYEARRGFACTRCGYDMRANAGGPCPECGLTNAALHPYHPPGLSTALAVTGLGLLAVIFLGLGLRTGWFGAL
jgi:hypothetical protein